MHYNITRFREAAPLEKLHALPEDAVRCTPPSRVDEGNRALLGDRQVHRNTVGDGDREQHTALTRRMSIDAIEDEPAVGQRLVPADVGAMHLMSEHNRGKAGAEGGAERAPAADHLPDRFVTP